MAAYSCVGSGAPTRISVWPVGRAACSLCGTGSVIGCAPVTPPAGGMIAAVFPVQKHGQTLMSVSWRQYEKRFADQRLAWLGHEGHPVAGS